LGIGPKTPLALGGCDGFWTTAAEDSPFRQPQFGFGE
jgi:hypothetical protein